MNRRTILKRLGAAGLAVPALAASASATDPTGAVPFEGYVVREGGDVFVYKAGVDADVVPTEDCCTCDNIDGVTICDSSCDCCRYCDIV